jgi:hypothetical protein
MSHRHGAAGRRRRRAGACRSRCWTSHATDAGDVYSRKLVLSRPDQHVAWRGDALPADPLVLIDRGSAARPV